MKLFLQKMYSLVKGVQTHPLLVTLLCELTQLLRASVTTSKCVSNLKDMHTP